jgi:hypothetical protein
MRAIPTDISVNSNVQGDVAKMGISDDAKAHIMDVLSKALYSEPVYAVIREYSTNARDAHIEAGNDAPIEVTLPNLMKPIFKVRDYGVGLSVDDIHNIYSQYGTSTKRDSDEYNGYLGLGCKSAFSYTDQFTVTSVKDGVRIMVMVTRDADGTGEMTTVDTRTTDEPNGTEVMVPVKQHEPFLRWADHLFRFWPEGTVVYVDSDGNRTEPKRLTGLNITDSILVVDGDQDYIVMGGVPYPVNLDHEMSGKALVAYVENGAVTFTPSREALKMNVANTMATIERIRVEFQNGVKSAVQDAINAATSGPEALSTLTQWQRNMPKIASGEDYTYKRRRIPTSFSSFKGEGDNDSQRVIVIKQDNYYGKLKDHSILHQAYSRVSWPKTLWIVGFDRAAFTATTRKKIDQYASDNGISWNHALLMEDKPKEVLPWVEKSMVVDWSLIQAIKLPRKGATNGGRITGSYDCFVAGQWTDEVVADDIDTDEPLFYVIGDYSDGAKVSKVLTNLHPDCTIVTFYTNREAKFCRDFPMARRAMEGVQEAYNTWLKKLSRKDRLALAVQDMHNSAYLKKLDPKLINDPELVFAIKLAKRDVSKIDQQRRTFSNLLHRIDTTGKLKWDNPLKRYPMFTECSTYSMRDYMDHIYIYINAVYAAANTKES